jgi:hypothetical protein
MILVGETLAEAIIMQEVDLLIRAQMDRVDLVQIATVEKEVAGETKDAANIKDAAVRLHQLWLTA